MIEEIAHNLYRIEVALPGNPLKILNSYYIKGDNRELLIDTGFRMPECQAALEQGLEELGTDLSKRDVLATHLHSDHFGMVDLFCGPGREIFMSAVDVAYEKKYLYENLYPRMLGRFLAEGMSKDELDIIYSGNPARNYNIKELPDNMHPLEEGDVIEVGEYKLKMISTPGHTPGNAMFWLEEQGIMFTGDHVLFDISPNITAWVDVEDSLGDYLHSLEKVKHYPVKQALPGHRKTGDYQERVQKLLDHHDHRIREALRIIGENPGLNAYEITAAMRWKIRAKSWEDFPVVQKWFAMGECMAHLDYLAKRKVIERRQEKGIWKYYSIV